MTWEEYGETSCQTVAGERRATTIRSIPHTRAMKKDRMEKWFQSGNPHWDGTNTDYTIRNEIRRNNIEKDDVFQCSDCGYNQKKRRYHYGWADTRAFFEDRSEMTTMRDTHKIKFICGKCYKTPTGEPRPADGCNYQIPAPPKLNELDYVMDYYLAYIRPYYFGIEFGSEVNVSSMFEKYEREQEYYESIKPGIPRVITDRRIGGGVVARDHRAEIPIQNIPSNTHEILARVEFEGGDVAMAEALILSGIRFSLPTPSNFIPPRMGQRILPVGEAVYDERLGWIRAPAPPPYHEDPRGAPPCYIDDL